MLAPPDDLPDAVLAPALGHSWAIVVASAEYRAVGWGSHHWDVADAAGSRRFVTADDLAEKRLWEDGRPPAAGPLATGPLAAGRTRGPRRCCSGRTRRRSGGCSRGTTTSSGRPVLAASQVPDRARQRLSPR